MEKNIREYYAERIRKVRSKKQKKSSKKSKAEVIGEINVRMQRELDEVLHFQTCAQMHRSVGVFLR